MADKEERILITKCSSHCHALRVSCDPFDGDNGMYCDKSGKWVKITDKDCAKCKSPVLAGITRAEAVEKMAKALHHNELRYVDLLPWVYLDSEIKRQFLEKAEAALNALLGKEKENGR